jgi:hypothetical protein
MASVLTFNEWLALVNEINDLALNPPSGCDPVDPMPVPVSPEKWNITDVTLARNKLMELCGGNEFLAPSIKWNQELVNEISYSIFNVGWCGCSPCPQLYERMCDFNYLESLPQIDEGRGGYYQVTWTYFEVSLVELPGGGTSTTPGDVGYALGSIPPPTSPNNNPIYGSTILANAQALNQLLLDMKASPCAVVGEMWIAPGGGPNILTVPSLPEINPDLEFEEAIFGIFGNNQSPDLTWQSANC